MARLGTFNPAATPLGWFADEALAEGWFVQDLMPPDAPAAAGVPYVSSALLVGLALAWTPADAMPPRPVQFAFPTPAPVVVDQPIGTRIPVAVLPQWEVVWEAQRSPRVAPLTLVYGDAPRPRGTAIPAGVALQWLPTWDPQSRGPIAPQTLVYGDQPPRLRTQDVTGNWIPAWSFPPAPVGVAAWTAPVVVPTFVSSTGIPWQVLEQWNPPWRGVQSASGVAPLIPVTSIVYENIPFKRHRGRR